MSDKVHRLARDLADELRQYPHQGQRRNQLRKLWPRLYQLLKELADEVAP